MGRDRFSTRRRLLIVLSAVVGFALQAHAAEPSKLDPDLVMNAVVGIKARALPNARSNATLGRERQGSGVVIDEAGHVLTIGYIVTEPDSIELTTASGKTVPAILAGYDHATGFGLLRPQAPLDTRPLPLGDSGALAEREPVLIVPFGGREAAQVARVMATRRFTGSWEYMLEQAIFTAPPTMAWAGAALVNREGRLVGVGSLLVRDTVAPGKASPGNMFVPTDTLKPILADLVAQGKRAGPQRPWLGLSTEEVQGRLLVSRVSPGSPSDQAGVREGDIVVGVGSAPVKTHAELYERVWGLGPAGAEVPLRVLQGVDVREVRVKSIDRDAYFERKRGM